MAIKLNSQPFFSIIIPCLNEEKIISHILSDLNIQIFTNYEVFVVDGMSDDQTQAIVRKFPQVKLITSPKRNVSYQRNLGANKAKGKYLIFFDADTRIDDYFLAGLAYKLKIKKPDMFTCWTKVDPKQSDSQLIANLINMSMEIYKFVESPTAIGAMMGMLRSVFKKIGGFNEQITFGEDSELVKRGASVGYSYTIIKDLRYIYSLRRFKSEGTLPMLQKYAKLNSGILLHGYPTQKLDNDYPMLGGGLYLKTKHKNKFIEQIENSLQKVKQMTDLKKWVKYWDKLIRDL